MDSEPILGFKGKYRWLSNFWVAPITWMGMSAPCNEHIYQACKTLDLEKRKYILSLLSPGMAKRAGGKPDRHDWEIIKEGVMYAINKEKYRAHPDLAAKLVATGFSHIEEVNTWGDTYWGTYGGRGSNKLGSILMQIRRELVIERQQRGL